MTEHDPQTKVWELFDRWANIGSAVAESSRELTKSVNEISESIDSLSYRLQALEGSREREVLLLAQSQTSFDAMKRELENLKKDLVPLALLSDEARQLIKQRKEAEKAGTTTRATLVEILKSPWGYTIAIGALWVLSEFYPWVKGLIKATGGSL